MKYLIGNLVINSDHIVKARYFPETPDDTEPNDRPSACDITTVDDGEIRLRGKNADAFWSTYSGDAYSVVV